MPADEQFRNQVELLIKALPSIAEEDCFALKGGTAINLFLRNMPRLSVDIDLVYLPLDEYGLAQEKIDYALKRTKERIGETVLSVQEQSREGTNRKLFVHGQKARIKIEVSPVTRGFVFDPEKRDVHKTVENQFGFASMQVVSIPDLYAGKLVAALDRQHPRDLFDVRELLKNEGIDDRLRTAFIVYLISNNRPIHEVLDPKIKDISEEFRSGLAGMLQIDVTLEELKQAHVDMISSIVGRMPEHHKLFLSEFIKGNPDWSLLEVSHAKELPAVKWKMKNLDHLDASQRLEEAERTEVALEQSKSDPSPSPSMEFQS